MIKKYHRQCSCTDCLHSIGVERMSPHLNVKGSQIDQLYYGEHSLLRERKLHDKSIKSKAVYNYDRNNFYSGTETIIYNAKYARNHYGEMDDGDKRHKNSSFCTMVDCLGDEGDMDQDPRDPKDELSDCQSCYSCSTMQPHRNADVINNHRAKPANRIQTSSSSHLYAKCKKGDRNRKMRAVHFNTKYIRSEPCTCTINFFSESVNNRKKFNDIESVPTTIESKAIKAKRCICECDIIRKPNKSLQRLKNAKEKVKNSIRSSISKIENSFRIRKDSIMMFRDKLMRKRALKKYECEPYYCIPEYSPPKCHERIKMRLNDIKTEIKRSFHDLRSITSGISLKTRPKKEKSESKQKSKSKPVICICEPELETDVPIQMEFEDIDKIDEKAFSSKKNVSPSFKRNGLVIHIEPSILPKKQSTKPPPTPKPKSLKHICEFDREEKRRIKKISKKSFKKTKPSFEYARYALSSLDPNYPKECEASMCIPDECDLRKCGKVLQTQSKPQDTSEYSSTHFSQKSGGDTVVKKSKHNQSIVKNEHHTKSENIDSKRQAVRISSNFSFNIEFYKDQKKAEKGDELPEYRIRKHKPRDEKSVSSKTIYSNSRKVCHRNKSVQSKTNYSLKRCFCTLGLKDAPKSERSYQSLKNKQIKTQTIGECSCVTKQKRSTQTKHKQLLDLPTPSLAPLEDICGCNSVKNCDFVSSENIFQKRLEQNGMKPEARPETENKRKYSKGTTSQKKFIKKESNNICKCNTTTQKPGQVANVKLSVLPPFSTSVKCNDLTCKRNIKKNYHVNGSKNKSINTLTDTGSSKRQMCLTRSIKTLPDTGSSKRQMSYQNKTLKSLSSKYFTPYGQETSPHRQAVRIGSSFSFNVEFYKDTNSEKKTTTMTGKGDGRNNNFRNKNKERIFQAINIPSLHQNNNDTKESCIKPFLDKCFCSLKLRKGRKDTIRISNPKLQSKTNTTNMKDMKSRDCQCEFKKSTCHALQKTKQSMANDCYKSTSSGTSKSYIKNYKCPTHKFTKPDSIREKGISRNTVSSEHMNERSESNKRVVRIGSSFSFNVEFFKEKGDAPSYNEMQPVVMDQRRKTIKTSDKSYEDKIKPLDLQKHKYYKNTLSHLLPNDDSKTRLSKCSKRCKKHNKIDSHEISKPKARIKSVTQSLKKSYIKNILETCKCDKTIKPKQKSCKHVARKISYRATTCVPEKMQPVKYKTQKTQSNFYKPSIKDMKQPKAAMKTLTKQLVRISSNFGSNTELRKRNSKLNDFKIKNTNKSEAKRNSLKNRQSMFGNKSRKSSNIGLMLKHCLCSIKHSKQTKYSKMRNDNEKETQLNLPIPLKCQRYMCEKYVTANRKQPKAKSVSDLKGPCLKTKKVQSSFREHKPCTKKYSDQNIKREKTRLKHRIQNGSSKKAVNLGSEFKFDIEFYKKYESPDYQEDKSSLKKQRRDTKQINFNSGRKGEIYNDKIYDKRLCGSCFQRHREYQVGYMREEVTARAFQQEHRIWNMCLSGEHLKKTIQIVNPVLIQSNPFKEKRHTKSSIRGKGKKKSKWRKKHVKFAVSNIETMVKHNYSLKPLTKNKRVRSEIYDTCFCESYEVLQPKRSLLRAPSHAFSSSTKMPKERFNLQFKEKTSKLTEITPSKKNIFHRKIFKNIRSTYKKYPTKFKSTQTVVNSLGKPGWYCICNINRIKEKVKGLVPKVLKVSNSSNYSSNMKTLSNLGLIKSDSKNIRKLLKNKDHVKLKQRNCEKIREKKPKLRRIQRVFNLKNDEKIHPSFNTSNNHNEYNDISFSKGQDLKNEKSERQSTKPKANYAEMKKRSRTIKSIVKSTRFPNTTRFNENDLSYIRDKNPSHKGNTENFANEISNLVVIETIMPYSKKNFRKRCSRTCLSKECKLLIKTTEKNYDNAKNLEIICAISKTKGDHKKPKLHKLSQKFCRKTTACHDICLKQAKTNIVLENKPNRRTKEGSRLKRIVRNNRSESFLLTNVDNLSMTKTCCVCCKRYSDTRKEEVQPKAQDKSYSSKENNKPNIKYKPSTHKPHNIFKENIVKKTTSCECGSKICKKKSKLWSSLTPSIESNVICLCHHVCECSATLKNTKKEKQKNKLTKQKKKLTKQNKQITKKHQSEKQISKKENSKLIKTYNQTSDSMLLAESCLDVTKMSAEFLWRLLKLPYQVISDPKSSCENFKTGMRKPANRAINIQQKICAMRVTKNVKDMLKSFTVINYLIHAFDDDPKKRLEAIKSKKRMKKIKERIDFGCSPFMASLRNRPFLWVYDKCPAFYPQFISLLAGLRQFKDMFLFLTAVVVWSPCIFGIEMCRAIMCCCFCTG